MVRNIPGKDEDELMNILDTVTHLQIIPEANSRVLRTKNSFLKIVNESFRNIFCTFYIDELQNSKKRFHVAHIQVRKKEINICRCVFTSSMERKIKKLHVVQRRFKDVSAVTKSLQSSCFAY